MISDPSEFKKFRVTNNLRENTMHEFFSWMRFVMFDENYITLIDFEARAANKNSYYEDSDDEEGRQDNNRGFRAKELPALSVQNETRVLLRMKLECIRVLGGYDTPLDDDLKRLVDDGEGNGPTPLTENDRNALLMRSGEKKVLKYLIETADIMLPLFKMTLQNAKKSVKELTLTEDQSDYIKSVVYTLIRKN